MRLIEALTRFGTHVTLTPTRTELLEVHRDGTSHFSPSTSIDKMAPAATGGKKQKKKWSKGKGTASNFQNGAQSLHGTPATQEEPLLT